MKFNILSINEWKESDNYNIHKFFKTKQKYFNNLFNNNQLYKDLELDKFDYDTSAISENVRFAYLFFSDKEYDYKLTLIINYKLLKNKNNIDNDNDTNTNESDDDTNIEDNENDTNINFIVTELEYKLNGEKINSMEFDNNEEISTIIVEDELTDDFLITLISEFKNINKIK